MSSGELRRRTLADGRAAVLRRATPADAEDLWRLQVALAADGRGMVLLAAEVPDGPEPQRQQLVQFAQQPENLVLAVEVAGSAVATLDVTRMPRRMIAHNAYLTMGVHPDYQGLGLGGWLLEAAVGWARTSGVVNLELNVLADNARAIALYRSRGFVEVYRRERFLRRPDGTWCDDLQMLWRSDKEMWEDVPRG